MSYVKAPQSFFFRLQNLSLPFRNQESKERVESVLKKFQCGFVGSAFRVSSTELKDQTLARFLQPCLFNRITTSEGGFGAQKAKKTW